MNRPDLYVWASSPLTQKVLLGIQEEIEKAQEEILDGSLIVSPALDREFCRAMGYIDGLKFLSKYIKEVEHDNELGESA